MKRLMAASALVAMQTACSTSVRVDRYLPAMEPAGIRGELTTTFDRAPLRAELLAIDDSSYVVLVRDRVTVAPFRLLKEAEFDPIGTTTRDGRAPSTDHRTQLKFASRFPYGIPAEAMSRLLEKSAQQRPDVLSAPSPQ
ncbi:MAG: hypothetical protein ACJ8AD_07850 [Gemmatimonadaceae bacterium]